MMASASDAGAEVPSFQYRTVSLPEVTKCGVRIPFSIHGIVMAAKLVGSSPVSPPKQE
jgi:hypothetical protein